MHKHSRATSPATPAPVGDTARNNSYQFLPELSHKMAINGVFLCNLPKSGPSFISTIVSLITT